MLKKSIKAIIFDCDGTLIDTEHAHFRSWQIVLNKRGVAFSREEYFLFSGQSGIAIRDYLCDRQRIIAPETLLDDKQAAYYELRKKGTPPIHSVVKWVHELAAQKERLNLKMGVASAAEKDEILLNLAELKITDLFDVIVSGRDDLNHYQDPEGVNKPKPYIYLHTAKLLGLHPTECVAIEDSHPGVTAASKAGYITIAVPNDFTKTHDFSNAHHVIDPAADFDLFKLLQLDF